MNSQRTVEKSQSGPGQRHAQGESRDPRRVEAAVLSPAEHYDQPADVLRDQRLTKADKRRILESWARDAVQLLQADDENMPGSRAPRLGEVRRALLALESN
jgi:hypothetical protein